jgi:mRNA-degrading endonuclease RelE of RelBE toxin-antitoxin system
MKKPREGYSSVLEDICTALISMPDNIIRDINERIIQTAEMRVIKLRVQNSGQKLAKSNGFRLVYMVSNTSDSVVLLTIFPKRGSKGIDNIPNAEYIRLLKELSVENREGKLHQVDITNNLIEVSQRASLK